jgi:hypothetical protein
MKTLIFEGAGWNKAESSGEVGNCRIRTTFLNKNGQEIYLELNSIIPHGGGQSYQRGYNIYGWISHLFYTKDRKTNYSDDFSNLNHKGFEWNKENILKLVNGPEIQGEFNSIEVQDEWNGFKLNGEKELENEN